MTTKGYKQTGEHRRKISENHARWNKGKKLSKLSEEHKEKISKNIKLGVL